MDNKEKTVKSTMLLSILLLILFFSSCNNTSSQPKASSSSTVVSYASLQYGNDYDETDIEWQSTPESSCFSRIGYNKELCVLGVEFRSTGLYFYYNFPSSEWSRFRKADSKGTWYNDHIKGSYDFERR